MGRTPLAVVFVHGNPGGTETSREHSTSADLGHTRGAGAAMKLPLAQIPQKGGAAEEFRDCGEAFARRAAPLSSAMRRTMRSDALPMPVVPARATF
jgi:hypothetical protein